jgi:hypothetical protein
VIPKTSGRWSGWPARTPGDLAEVVPRLGDALQDVLEVPGEAPRLGDRAAGQRSRRHHALQRLGVLGAHEPDPVAPALAWSREWGNSGASATCPRGTKRKEPHRRTVQGQTTPYRRVRASALGATGWTARHSAATRGRPRRARPGWSTCWCEGGGLGGQPQRGEHAAREVGVHHERRDGVTTAARAGCHRRQPGRSSRSSRFRQWQAPG